MDIRKFHSISPKINHPKEKTVRMAIDTENTPYIPTLSDWARLYSRWFKKIAGSLRMFGDAEECEEAVHEAFMKVAGLSDHLALRDELTPKVDNCWFGFVRNQAKGILSHRHEAARRFEPVKEYKLSDGIVYDEEPEEQYNSGLPVILPVEHAGDEVWFRNEVRRAVADVCREAGVSDRNLAAFVKFVLDERDGDEVVNDIPSLKNANNLYQIRSRIMKLLKSSSGRFERARAERLAA